VEIAKLAGLSSLRRDNDVDAACGSGDEPLVAVVLPPREGFGPGRAGAIGLLARRQVATPGFRTVIIGGPQPGPVFPDVAFEPVQPSLLWPGNINLRFAQAASRMLRRMSPALIEVHNRPEIALRLARRLPHVPVTLLLHNDPQSMRAARTPAERAILLRRMALVMTSSGYLRDRLLDGLEAPPGSVAVQPNCIDLAELPEPRPRERLILFAGRVVPDKGPDMFVAACSRALPQLLGWRAEIIGADRFSETSPSTAFVRRVQKAAVDAGVTMVGYLDHPLVLEANARASIAVVPSRWPEPFGLTALEALASGAALITSGRGGLREVAGDAAVYVDPDSPASIADAILRLAKDASLREALGAAGRERARRFDVSVAAERIAALRRQVLAGRTRPRSARSDAPRD
jgi:UDP-glucose:(glucosyl)LPS alpha-1,2-glucosyltransferase